jgi:epsin
VETDIQGNGTSHASLRRLTDKALQLLEFLIKNGSERVIDDARAHVSLLKMLRQFHFIDQNGKDQGINVRNRAKELAELLSDVDRIRTERKKARANRNKFGGVEGGAGMGGFSGSGGFSGGSGTGSRYGGFGSESADFGGYRGEVYGDGGGFGGNQSGFADTQQRRDRFDEYDEYDEGDASPAPRRKEPATSQVKKEPKKEEPKAKAKAPEPVADLLAWDDEPAPVSSSAGKQPAPSSGNDLGDDDDFDDFQSAAPAAPVNSSGGAAFSIAPPASTSTITSSTQFAAPQAQSAVQNNNLNNLFATVSPPPAANKMSAPPSMSSSFSHASQPAGYQASGPNYFTSVAQSLPQSGASTPSVMSPGGRIGGAAPKKAAGDAFASLLAGAAPKKASTPTQKVTMGDLAKQKTSQGLWGAPASNSSTPAAQPAQSGSKPGGALGDLLG